MKWGKRKDGEMEEKMGEERIRREREESDRGDPGAVSYTHLTLPTIYSV